MKKTKYITLTLALSLILVACNNEKTKETNIETTNEQKVVEVKDETFAETTKETQEETKAEEIEESVEEKVEEELEKEVKKIEQEDLSKEEKEKQIEKAEEKVEEKVAKEEKVDKKKVEKTAKAEVKNSVKKAESKNETKKVALSSKTTSKPKTTTTNKTTTNKTTTNKTTSNKTTSKPKTTTTNKTTVKEPVVVVERYTDTDPIHYQTIDKYKGQGTKSKVVQKGKDGSITKVRNVTFTDDVKTDEELVDTIIVEPVNEIIARYVKVQDAKYETKEVEDKTKPVYGYYNVERWFVRNQETGEIKYFYSAKEANDYHKELSTKVLTNWGTAPMEKVYTDEIWGYDYKTVEVKVQDEKWEWKY